MRIDSAPLKSNAEWRAWGERDPLWAVATEPAKRRGLPEAWTDLEFYAAGKSDWNDFFPHWRRYGVNLTTGVEIGCGAGRLTRQAAQEFHALHAVDVSPHMIAYAKRAVSAPNVAFHLTDGRRVPLADASVTAIYSTHVFQHLDGADPVFGYFEECFRMLAPGCTLMVHVPIHEWPGYGRIAALLRNIHGVLAAVSNTMAWLKRQLGLELMRGTSVHGATLFHVLQGIGFRDIEFKTIAATRNGALHSFVFARKNGDQ
jgi:SAM-dependent methyltransferase